MNNKQKKVLNVSIPAWLVCIAGTYAVGPNPLTLSLLALTLMITVVGIAKYKEA